MKYNVFKQLQEKGIKFMSSYPAELKMAYDKKEFYFFLMFPQWIQQFWKTLLKLKDK